MICPKWRWYWPFHLMEFYGTSWHDGQFRYVWQCARCRMKSAVK